MNQASVQPKSMTRPAAPRPSLRPKSPPAGGSARPLPKAAVPPRSRSEAADFEVASPSPKRRGWPILEVVVALLLIKIAVGGWYLLSGPERDAGLSGDGHLTVGAAQVQFGTPAAPEQLPTATQHKSSKVEGYLSAAAQVVIPSAAQAAPPAISGSAPIAAGAFMVIGAQAAVPPMAQGGSPDSIPLPPDADLLTPAAQLPPPVLPNLGGSPDSAPLPPNVAAPSTEALRDIRTREQALTRKEADLGTREEALSALEAELRRRMEASETFRAENEALLKRNEAVLAELKALKEEQEKEETLQKDARIQHLVTAYGGMKPEQAGNLVNSLDDDVAVNILAAMSGRKAGLILAFVNPEKAARLTKAISDMRLDPNMLLTDNANPLGGAPAPPAGQ